MKDRSLGSFKNYVTQNFLTLVSCKPVRIGSDSMHETIIRIIKL